MVALPPSNRIRNFSPDLDSPRLFRSEALALRALFADPTLFNLAAEQANLPEIGHLSSLSPSRIAGVGLIGTQSLEMRIGASLQNIFQHYQWYNDVSRGKRIAYGELPDFSVIAANIDGRRQSMLDESVAQLRDDEESTRPVDASDLTKEMFKALLLEVGTLHVLLHTEGACDAISAIRARHSRKHRSEYLQPIMHNLFRDQPVEKDEMLEVQQRVDHIYQSLQASVCAAIPDNAMIDVIENPFNATLVKSTLRQISQLYFHMYHANGLLDNSFLSRLANKSDPGQNQR